jgi:hypothetical protein
MIESKYNYLNLVTFASKYNCEILDCAKLVNSNPDKIRIKSKCGHYTMQSANNFMKKKIGIYPISEDQWIDMGQWNEYQKALENL